MSAGLDHCTSELYDFVVILTSSSFKRVTKTRTYFIYDERLYFIETRLD